MTNAYVPVPGLDLRDDTPVSTSFGDVYFSRAGGIAETEHVFLRGNGLPERWQGKARFTVGELGFGTGLNFLTTLKRFRETADATATLHYISIEKFPFTPEKLQEVLALQPELATEAAELLAAYPLRLPGLHRIHLPRVVLTLCFGEVSEMLAEISSSKWSVRSASEPAGQGSATAGSEGDTRSEAERGAANVPFKQQIIDTWFLDGFSPAKNPDMWREEILTRIGELSAPAATFATFTSAGFVKRGLQSAGFTVEKIPGFGHKRDMLVGRMRVENANSGAAGEPSPPAGEGRAKRGVRGPSVVRGLWLAPSPLRLSPPKWGASLVASPARGEVSPAAPPSPQTILILGAGIAGATLARALAERGHRVTVLERGHVASGASGNAAGVLYPQLTKHWTRSCALSFTAYGLMLRNIARWKSAGLNFSTATPGMLRLPRTDDEAAQLQTLNEALGLDPAIAHWLPRDAASEQAGVNLQTGAAYFPHGTWISPPELCRALLQHENITLRKQTLATALARTHDGWQITLADGEQIITEKCCITAAEESATFLADYGIRLGAVGGQVSEFAAADVATPLRSILCRKGYVIPRIDAPQSGETLHRVAEGEPAGQGSAALAAKGTRSPSSINYLTGATYHRENMLAVTDEHHAENIAELEATLPGWFHGNIINGRSSIRATTPDRLPYIGAVEEGLYVSTGHGSRGLLFAPLAAEIIASMIGDEQLPVTRELAAAVNPLRFRKG